MRLAIAQVGPAGDLQANLDRTRALVRKRSAKARGLVVFPELHLSGYRPDGHDAAERGPSDARTRKLVAASFEAVREVLVGELAQARERGELSAQAGVEELADFLLVTIEGLHVVAKGTRDRRLAESAIETTLRRL